MVIERDVGHAFYFLVAGDRNRRKVGVSWTVVSTVMMPSTPRSDSNCA